ncbi:hypothetical protein ACFY0G_17375 [Streptomyces sp. NPDC001552]|uniref:hypothetical protein n=1 Tax=Streptomyces sp. NPDC001552 TaxID=3364587 RepID=UPI0036C2C48A
MSLYPILWAVDHAPVLDAEERAILVALVVKGDFDGCNCFRSYRTLAEKAMVSAKTAGRRCREMAARGILQRQEEHLSKAWWGIPKEQRPVPYEVMIPAEFWSASQLADINEQRAALGRPPITPANRPALAPAPPKKERADKGVKRPKKGAGEASEDGRSGDLGDDQSSDPGTCSPGGDPGTCSPHPQDFKSLPPGLVVPQPSESPSESPSEKTAALADAVGHGAGGFGSAGSSAGATDETREADGGSAASQPNLPPQRTQSPRPTTIQTKPRKASAGFEMVRAAIPAAVARPGTKLYPGLHRAINELLDGNQSAGIPRRTPEQVIARLSRRWWGEQANRRSASDYRGCPLCTSSGCTAPRRDADNPDGCDRIKNKSSWLETALLTQDCPDPACEDGLLIDGGECRTCQMRHREDRAAARAGAELSARLDAQQAARDAVHADLRIWETAESAEETRLRIALTQAGAYGALLDDKVERHMNGWRERNPRPAAGRAVST